MAQAPYPYAYSNQAYSNQSYNGRKFSYPVRPEGLPRSPRSPLPQALMPGSNGLSFPRGHARVQSGGTAVSNLRSPTFFNDDDASTIGRRSFDFDDEVRLKGSYPPSRRSSYRREREREMDIEEQKARALREFRAPPPPDPPTLEKKPSPEDNIVGWNGPNDPVCKGVWRHGELNTDDRHRKILKTFPGQRNGSSLCLCQ